MSEIEKTRDVALAIGGTSVHLYGKAECRKGRKMGHITVVAESDTQLRERLRPLLLSLPDTTQEEADKYAALPAVPGAGYSDPNPLVGIIMGSDSDLPVMLAAARILDQFEVPYELTIVSAHRTPDRMVEYARSAATRGLRTIIAGAGGAAHLPGMVAAMTALPVIGVPVKGSTLDGVDSLHSIVQMPVRDPPNNRFLLCLLTASLLAWHSCRNCSHQQQHECRTPRCSHSVCRYPPPHYRDGAIHEEDGKRSAGQGRHPEGSRMGGVLGKTIVSTE